MTSQRQELSMMRKLALTALFCSAFLAAPAASAAPPPPQPAQPKWTFMVYIAGDNSLTNSVVTDIEEEMGAIGSNADVNIVVLADRAANSSWSQTLVFHVTPGMLAVPENAVLDMGELNMGDPATLADFVTWTKANYPADHYALSLWNHGWGWHPGWSMSDDTSIDALDQDEIVSAMTSAGPIDVLAYDACYMGTIENDMTARQFAQAIWHSQEYMGFEGIRYDMTLAALQLDPLMTAQDLAVQISLDASTGNQRTGSAVALDANFDVLVTAVDQLGAALLAELPTYRSAYTLAFKSAQAYTTAPTAKDLYDVAAKLKANVASLTIKARCDAVMSAVNAVVRHNFFSPKLKSSHGISIFVPRSIADLGTEFPYYRNNLLFSQQTSWDEFLNAYLYQ